jgi:sugar lactone lactonase YvrE
LFVLGVVVAASTFAACSGGGGAKDATETTLSEPGAVAVGADGAFYVADTGHCTVWKVANQKATAIMGTGVCSPQPAESTQFLREVGGVAVAGDGTVYASDTRSCLIRQWRAGTLSIAAGNGRCAYGGDGSAASEASINNPSGLALDDEGTLYVADSGNCRVRQIRGGVISGLAGGVRCGYAGDGGSPAVAELDDPTGIAVDAQGRLYVAEAANCRVRMIDGDTISTLAGDGSCAFGEQIEDPGAAGLGFPRGVAVGGGGTVYIADTHGCRVLAVQSGAVSVVAGNGSCGFGGDGGNAAAAQLDLPGGIAVAANGDLYIADTQNCSVRLVHQSVITTVAGRGSC